MVAALLYISRSFRMVAERVYFSTARYTETKVYKKPIRTKLKYILMRSTESFVIKTIGYYTLKLATEVIGEEITNVHHR